MDGLAKTWKQATSLWGSLAPSQRLSLVVAPVLLLGGFAYLLWGSGSDATMTPLVFGKAMTDDELDAAENVLSSKGFREFRRSGNQLLVPVGKAEDYHGALLAGGGLPMFWAEDWEENFNKSSIFTSSDQRRAMREIALAKELRRWLRAIPEVVDGSVVWARSQQPVGFKRRDDTVKATVKLQPKPGSEISNELAESIRMMIANAVPDLTPEQVVVFSTTGRAFTPEDPNDPMGGQFLRRISEFNNSYRQRVEDALSYIPNVLVTVHVELENIRSDSSVEYKVDPKEVIERYGSSTNRERSSTTERPSAEPGAVSNQPRTVQANAGPMQSTRDTTTESTTILDGSRQVRRTEYHPGMPTNVEVAIGIPEEYYENAVVNKGIERGEDDASKQAFEQAVADFKTTVQTDVRETVARAISTTDEKISVTSFVRVDPVQTVLTEPMLDRVLRWLHEWGGTLGLAMFAAWALWMVVRTNPSMPEEPDEEPLPVAAPAPVDEPEEVVVDPVVTAREQLQTTVRENPEVAAAVIGKWIRAAQVR